MFKQHGNLHHLKLKKSMERKLTSDIPNFSSTSIDSFTSYSTHSSISDSFSMSSQSDFASSAEKKTIFIDPSIERRYAPLISEEDLALLQDALAAALKPLETIEDKVAFISQTSPLRARVEFMLYLLDAEFQPIVINYFLQEQERLKSKFSKSAFEEIFIFHYPPLKDYAETKRYLQMWERVVSRRVIEEQSIMKYLQRPEHTV